MFDDQHHSHAHGNGNGHEPDHDHEHDVITEAPLDAANQSLSDALRASFWVLKLVMIIVVVLFLLSGMFTVDAREVAVVATFGKASDLPRQPGLHWAWPYPIDEVIRVSTAPKVIRVEDFWLNLRDDEKSKPLDQLGPRSPGLDPAVDGALLTADRAIMHASFRVQYKVPETNAKEYVQNVRDDEELVRSVIRQAAVAEAARTPAEVLWRDPAQLAAGVQTRAQQMLDEELHAGIKIENVAIPNSHYPLQTASEFLAVNTAENHRRELINEAQSEREKKLNGMAGAAWERINAEIEKLDQVKTDGEREAIINKIGELLASEATGEAGGKIKLAQRDREKIINDSQVEVSQFLAALEQYHKNPELVRMQFSQQMRQKLFESKAVAKWILPPGEKQLVFWLNKDPKEVAEQEKARMEELTKPK